MWGIPSKAVIGLSCLQMSRARVGVPLFCRIWGKPLRLCRGVDRSRGIPTFLSLNKVELAKVARTQVIALKVA